MADWLSSDSGGFTGDISNSGGSSGGVVDTGISVSGGFGGNSGSGGSSSYVAPSGTPKYNPSYMSQLYKEQDGIPTEMLPGTKLVTGPDGKQYPTKDGWVWNGVQYVPPSTGNGESSASQVGASEWDLMAQPQQNSSSVWTPDWLMNPGAASAGVSGLNPASLSSTDYSGVDMSNTFNPANPNPTYPSGQPNVDQTGQPMTEEQAAKAGYHNGIRLPEGGDPFPNVPTGSQSKQSGWQESIAKALPSLIQSGLGLLGPKGQNPKKEFNMVSSNASAAQNAGNQLLQSGMSGKLDASQREQINQWSIQQKNKLKDYYSRAGLADSSMAASAIADVDKQALAMQADLMKQDIAQGLSALGYSSRDAMAIAAAKLKEDQDLQNQLQAMYAGIGQVAAPVLEQGAASVNNAMQGG